MRLVPRNALYECDECENGVVIAEYEEQAVSCTCGESRTLMERVGVIDDE